MTVRLGIAGRRGGGGKKNHPSRIDTVSPDNRVNSAVGWHFTVKRSSRVGYGGEWVAENITS